MDKVQAQKLVIELKDDLKKNVNEYKEKIQFCLNVLKFLETLEDNEIHEICPFNLSYQAGRLSLHYNQLKQNHYEYNDELFLICAGYLTEIVLYLERTRKDKNQENFYLLNLKYWFDLKNNKYTIDPNWKDDFHYTQYQMPIDILNTYIGQEDYQAFLNYEKTVKDAEERIGKLQEQLNDKEEKFNEKILEREEKVANLKASLENFQTAFNFVGLSQGFENLLKKKNQAKWWTFAGLVTLLLTALIPLCFSFYKFIQGGDLSWQKMLPVIGLEFVLIYFFRVVLTHYHSIQTQIMQLELRLSLCQFIQDYVKYAKDVKASMKYKDKDPLEKFENLIFSSILSNPDKVPGTFDGIDSLTTLLKEFKK